MTDLIKQHLINPELCIRCHACENACPIDAITHDENNVVVDASICNFCMNCVSPCPTGSIDNWHYVNKPYDLDEQLSWFELPEQQNILKDKGMQADKPEALDDSVVSLINQAHAGAGGKVNPPISAYKPTVNLYGINSPITVTVQGNYFLTQDNSDNEIHHIILNLGNHYFPILEGQSLGVIAPGVDTNAQTHLPRLYSVSSPRDGEREATNNLSITVKKEKKGVCSNYLAHLKIGDEIQIIGPFGSTFLMPDDLNAKLLMICTGTGSAPFRAFAMRRMRIQPKLKAMMTLFFGARTPDSLPFFGPLKKISDEVLKKHFAFSRYQRSPKTYVQDLMRTHSNQIKQSLDDVNTHIYVCGLKAMEVGVEQAFEDIARNNGKNWQEMRSKMREEGRYHVETY